MMNYRKPKFTASGEIDCEVEHPELGWIPFTASPDDEEQHGRDLFSKISKAGGVAEYVPPPPPTPEQIAEQQAQEARAKRDRLLKASDWTQVADAPVDQAAWATYRQALRDIPQQDGFPDDVTWPEKP